MSRPLRVVQWATGNIGARSLRGVIEHPRLELAGVYVYDDDKAGRDAGELCGVGRTGVVATKDEEQVLAPGVDCVLYMARSCDVDQVARILSSGANVVTTRSEFQRPANLAGEVRHRIETACRQGGSSLHSTGSSPGFITEAVPLVLTSIERRLDRLSIAEFADVSRRDSPVLLFELMGFGRTPVAIEEGRVEYLRSSFGPSLELVAEALGMPLDEVRATGELAVARGDVALAAGVVKAGTVAAQRTTVSGMRSGREVLRFEAMWYVTDDLDPAWPVRPTGWHISVEGDAPLEVDLLFPVPLERMGEMSPGYTANRAVNAVPMVCDAPPGIVTTVDLSQVVADLS